MKRWGWLRRYEVLVFLTALLGILAGARWPGLRLAPVFPVALFFMLWPVMLQMDLQNMRSVVKRPALLAIPLALTFLVSPLLAFWLSRLFIGNEAPGITAGLLLFGMMPSGGMVPAYTAMAQGNVELSLLVMTVSLLLSIGIVPVWTSVLIGKTITLPPVLVFTTTGLTILLPLVSALGMRAWIMKQKGTAAFDALRSSLRNAPACGLQLLVFGAFTANGERIVRNPFLVLKTAGIASAFQVILLMLASVVAKRGGLAYPDRVSVAVGSAVKNNAIALSIATLLFGPETVLTVAVAAALVQLPLMIGFVRLVSLRERAPAS